MGLLAADRSQRQVVPDVLVRGVEPPQGEGQLPPDAWDRVRDDAVRDVLLIESILKASGGFNPEAAFPPRCFPRPWPFVGGQLPPAPPPPPNRSLVVHKIGDKWKIVWRGEVPTVRVPRRGAAEIQDDTTIEPTNFNGGKVVRPGSRDPARDPP